METKTRTIWNRNLFLTTLTIVLFMICPFWSGLFFSVPIASSTITVGIFFLVVVIWAIVRKAEIKNFALMDALVTLYTLVVALSIFSYSHLEFTLTGISKQFGYFFVYWMVRLFVGAAPQLRSFLSVIASSGAVFSVYGMLNGFNVLHHSGALFAEERRVASVFEYPNTFASYLAIAALFGYAIQNSMTRTWSRVVWMILNALTMMGMIVSYSRGGWLLFFVTLLVQIFLAPKSSRGRMAFHAIASVIAMGAGLPLVSKAVAAGDAKNGFLGLAITIVAAAVLALFVDRIANRASSLTIKKAVLIPALIVILAGGGFVAAKVGLIPASVWNRMASINFQVFSVQQRVVFYKDGLSAIKDHPLIGAGDRTWEATFYKYQSYPYYTTAPHSVFIDQVMNTGILGTLLFLTVFILTVRSLWKLRRTEQTQQTLISAALFAGYLELVFHAAIDVDFNYAVIGYLFWGITAMGALAKPVEVETVTSLNAWKWAPTNRWFWWVGALVSIVVALFSSSYVYANHQIDLGKNNLANPAAALKHIDTASTYAPYLQEIGSLKVSMLDTYVQRTGDAVIKTELQNTLLKMPKISPENAELLEQAGQGLLKHERVLDAMPLLKRAWVDAPYRAEYGNQYAVASTMVGEAYLQQKKDMAKPYFQETVKTYLEMASRIEGFKQLPSVLFLERPYAINGSMQENTAIAYYYLGQYPQAEELAAAALKTKEANQTKVQALLLAVQTKEKKVDDALVNAVQKNQQANTQYNQFLKNQ